jgi:hypothetical protein
MLKKRWAIATAAACVLGLCLVSLSWVPRTAATPVASDADQAAFRGKVLLVRSVLESFILERAKVRQFGAHSFLVGTALEASASQGDVKGKTLWLNMNTVTSIVECEDADGAKKILKGAPQPGFVAPGRVIEAPAATDVPKGPGRAP